MRSDVLHEQSQDGAGGGILWGGAANVLGVWPVTEPVAGS